MILIQNEKPKKTNEKRTLYVEQRTQLKYYSHVNKKAILQTYFFQ